MTTRATSPTPEETRPPLTREQQLELRRQYVDHARDVLRRHYGPNAALPHVDVVPDNSCPQCGRPFATGRLGAGTRILVRCMRLTCKHSPTEGYYFVVVE